MFFFWIGSCFLGILTSGGGNDGVGFKEVKSGVRVGFVYTQELNSGG